MRDLRELDRYRNIRAEIAMQLPANATDRAGCFQIPGDRIPGTARFEMLKVIASAALINAWEHVSISAEKRCPTWPEMDKVKRLVWRDDETVMQLHVPIAEHINNHPFCLHLWRPVDIEIPRPPSEMVGLGGVKPADVRLMKAHMAGRR